MPQSRKRKEVVISLRGAIPPCGQPNQEIIGFLKRLLLLAEEGAISQVLAAWVGPAHQIEADWEGTAAVYESVAAVVILQDKVLQVFRQDMGEGR